MNSVSPAKAAEPIEMSSGCGLVGAQRTVGAMGRGTFGETYSDVLAVVTLYSSLFAWRCGLWLPLAWQLVIIVIIVLPNSAAVADWRCTDVDFDGYILLGPIDC